MHPSTYTQRNKTKQKVINVSEDWGNCVTLSGNINGTTTYGKEYMWFFKKFSIDFPYDLASTLLDLYP
jgi:hypothetical protein